MGVFRDVEDEVRDDIREILKDYTIEELLEENDLSAEEAIFHLWTAGWIDLPETQPVTVSRGGAVRFDEDLT